MSFETRSLTCTEMTSKNEEKTILIWFDPNIDMHDHDDDAKTVRKLKHVHEHLECFIDRAKCIKFIKSLKETKIFLITSGSKAREILPDVVSRQEIDSVLIFCRKPDRYSYLIHEYPKIIGIYTHRNSLCESLRERIDQLDKSSEMFSFFDQQKSMKDLSKQSGEFLWFQLFNHVITHLPRDNKAKQEMIEICKNHFARDRKTLKAIDRFDNQYQSDCAIKWYTKQSFVYRMINKALRCENLDLLFTFRFFIGDLSANLSSEHDNILSSTEKILTVYRGTKISTKEIDELKSNRRKLISINGYLSTSRNPNVALSFAKKTTKRTDLIQTLFRIECNVEKLGKNIIFADVAKFSHYPDEEEVLFDLNPCFEIESIEQENDIQLIKLNASEGGQTITKIYLKSMENETEEKSIHIVFGRLMCDAGKYDKSLKYFRNLLNNAEDRNVAWINYHIGRIYTAQGKWNKALKYYNFAYENMTSCRPKRIKDSTYVLIGIGNVLSAQGKWRESLDHYYQALELRKECYPAGHLGIADILNNIGVVLADQEKYNEALQHYQTSLEMQENFYPTDHIDIAGSLDNIGHIFFMENVISDALIYYHRALKIRQKHYPSEHPDIATNLDNIGMILSAAEKYDDALRFHKDALEMQEKCYPSDHFDIAQTLNNIGNVFFEQKEYDKAIRCHNRALEIRRKFYRSDHVDIGRSLNNIGACYEKKNNWLQALECYQQTLDIYKRCLPDDHRSRKRVEENIRRLSQRNQIANT